MTTNTNWKYYYSKILKMKYAVHQHTGELRTEDGVRYTRAEIMRIKEDNNEITPEIHNAKKAIDGEIVYMGKSETDI